MTLQFYKVFHIISIAAVFFALGSSLLAARLSLTKETNPWHKATAIIHGIALVLLLVSGFGMLAKLGILSSFPGWVYGKIAIWLALGYAMVLHKKGPTGASVGRVALFVLIAAAAYLSLYKPFS
jgi:uncharacterized membrane protein SirB2